MVVFSRPTVKRRFTVVPLFYRNRSVPAPNKETVLCRKQWQLSPHRQRSCCVLDNFSYSGENKKNQISSVCLPKLSTFRSARHVRRSGSFTSLGIRPGPWTGTVKYQCDFLVIILLLFSGVSAAGGRRR